MNYVEGSGAITKSLFPTSFLSRRRYISVMEPNDLEQHTAASSSYAALLDRPDLASPLPGLRRSRMGLAGILVCFLFLICFAAVVMDRGPKEPEADRKESDGFTTPATVSRGVLRGVSDKSSPGFSNDGLDYPWTNAMLSWQRTGYHFQPEKNWMNDPNGPLFYKGWYHLFYQYNPESAVWGLITWGHAVSRDLIHWLYLPFAMEPDAWYDINGVWTGSATFLPDGQIVMLYTGDTDELVQVQNLAYPANLSDPLLLEWVKYEGNPVMVPPPGIGNKDFRDPTTAWFGPDGKWRLAIGSKFNKTGITLVYSTTNFTSFELLDGLLHEVPGTGMWECVDFYPISTIGENGLDTSYNGPGVKHVLKASMDDNRKDYYAIGKYDVIGNTWTPDYPELDVGIGLRYDWGKFYASKTFYDQNLKRRILWGWIGETDSEHTDVLKGWASVQAIPRTVVLDRKTGTNLLQWPVKEVEKLRLNRTEFNGMELGPGTIIPLNITSANQVDIIATFEVDEATLKATVEADVGYNCSTAGASVRGALGPFGIIVLANHALTELTPVYFYIAKNVEGNYNTFFCSDELRSTRASDVNKRVYGSTVPVLDGEKLTMRLLVDHSIVENYAQGGRTVITSRIYPTTVIHGKEGLFIFNNATDAKVKVSLTVWNMHSADIRPFPLDEDQLLPQAI